MDYSPPKRPAVVVNADHQLLAQSNLMIFSDAFGNMGAVDTLPSTKEWEDTSDWEQRMHWERFKPGSRFVFAKPRGSAKPLFYIDEHKPCSIPTFDAYKRMVNTYRPKPLEDREFAPLHELLGDRLDPSLFRMSGGQLHVGDRDVLFISFHDVKENTYGEAVFVIADSKKRWIQEIGFEGANKQGKDRHWYDEAGTMLLHLSFRPLPFNH